MNALRDQPWTDEKGFNMLKAVTTAPGRQHFLAALILISIWAPPSSAFAAIEPSTSPNLVGWTTPTESGMANASTTITFSEFSIGTNISTQYSNQGIVFGGDSPFITTDSSNPTSPVLSGTPQFAGAIEGRFVNPEDGTTPITVTSFSLDAGYFDSIGSVRVSWFDLSGNLLGQQVNATFGIETFLIEDEGISSWRIATVDEEPAGFAIDNVSFSPENRICFYANTGIPGHGFVQFLPIFGSQAGQKGLVRGKYPGSWNLFTGNGVIKNDRKRPWDQRICYGVTIQQYNSAAAKVNLKQSGPTNYRLIKDPPGNCVNWMTDVADAAGLTLPDKLGIFGIGTPGEFSRSLQALGQGGTFQGGTVDINPNTGIGPDGDPVATEIPNNWDAEELALRSHANPVGLASDLNLSLNSFDLGDQTGGPSWTVQLNNLVLDEMLVSVDWGDGSPLEGQTNQFAHTYAPGSYTVSMAVINSGDIDYYFWDLTVTNLQDADPSLGSAIDITVPTPTPAQGSNPGFDEDVSDLEALLETLIFRDGFESGDTSAWVTTFQGEVSKE